jgi:hypothetical protein
VRVATRVEFVDAVRDAIVNGRGLAAGKLGTSEKTWLYAEPFLAKAPNRRQRLAFEANLKFHALTQSGLFPSDVRFLADFARRYADWVRRLDYVGLFFDRPGLERAVVEHYGFVNTWMDFVDQEPDRSLPADDRRCYLPACAGKRLVLVGALAPLLRERATPEIFERVWASTGKRWFSPASVGAVGVPYGYDAETRARFRTSIQVLDSTVAALAGMDFDVALIGAGGLGVPIAAAVKDMGKVGLSIGGHLQVLFGVMGRRWRERADWRATYVTDAWIDVPPSFRPSVPVEQLLEGGAYW